MGEVIGTGESEAANAPKRPSRRIVRAAGLMLILLSVLLAWFLVVGYLGWQEGQQQRSEQEAQALTELIARQLTLAENDINQGSYNLALRRLEWVLEQNPAHETALRLQAQVQDALNTAVTPSPPAVIGITAEETTEPTATFSPAIDSQSELQRIRRLVALKEWTEALPAILAFQRTFPEVERQETDRALFDSYVNLGLERIEGSNVELGLYYLNQAAELGDLPQSAEDYRTWAELYLQGISFSGANYAAAAHYFRELCLSAPFYQNACSRLQNTLILLGDQYAGSLDWCPAQQAYEEARTYGAVNGLSDKLTQAIEECLAATPTPETPTDPITDTLPITDSLRIFEPPIDLTTTPLP